MLRAMLRRTVRMMGMIPVLTRHWGCCVKEVASPRYPMWYVRVTAQAARLPLRPKRAEEEDLRLVLLPINRYWFVWIWIWTCYLIRLLVFQSSAAVKQLDLDVEMDVGEKLSEDYIKDVEQEWRDLKSSSYETGIEISLNHVHDN